jgi:hypothetical protein
VSTRLFRAIPQASEIDTPRCTPGPFVRSRQCHGEHALRSIRQRARMKHRVCRGSRRSAAETRIPNRTPLAAASMLRETGRSTWSSSRPAFTTTLQRCCVPLRNSDRLNRSQVAIAKTVMSRRAPTENIHQRQTNSRTAVTDCRTRSRRGSSPGPLGRGASIGESQCSSPWDNVPTSM